MIRKIIKMLMVCPECFRARTVRPRRNTTEVCNWCDFVCLKVVKNKITYAKGEI